MVFFNLAKLLLSDITLSLELVYLPQGKGSNPSPRTLYSHPTSSQSRLRFDHLFSLRLLRITRAIPKLFLEFHFYPLLHYSWDPLVGG
jgi:hypothetical protein